SEPPRSPPLLTTPPIPVSSRVMRSRADRLNGQVAHQPLLQLGASPRQSRFHGAERNSENLGDFSVGETLQVPEHDNGAVLAGELSKGLLDGLLRLPPLKGRLRRQVGRGRLEVDFRIRTARNRVVQRDRRVPVTPARPALPVEDLREG